MLEAFTATKTNKSREVDGDKIFGGETTEFIVTTDLMMNHQVVYRQIDREGARLLH